MYGTLIWVGEGDCGWVGHCFRWVGVGGNEWGWVGVSGVVALFDNAHLT